jgi:antirestriction protein ArdC
VAGKPKVNHGKDSDASFETTSTNEQIHFTGHESSLKRDLGGAFGKSRYAREELVAN